MLQAIRDRATGWMAWVIIILITVPFAFWGINTYFEGSTDTTVATVNGVDIEARDLETQYQQRRDRLMQSFGAQFRPEMLNEAQLRRESLDSLVRQQVLGQAARTAGFRVGDTLLAQNIAEIPLFHKEGRFDTEAYRAQLRNQGMSEGQFEAQMRDRMMTGQLVTGISESSFLTPDEAQEFTRLQAQTRNVQWAVLTADALKAGITPTDSDINQYYQQHQLDLAEPERLKLHYLELSVAQLGAALQPDEAALQALYQEMKDKFGTPEQRHARHILLTLAADATPEQVAQVQQQLEALRQQLTQGGDFAVLAKQHSQDPGSASQGGDLGWFGKGAMDAAFEAATFSLQPGEISAPVRSAFGWHLIQLQEVRPEQVKPLEEVRATVLAEWQRREGEKRFYELAEPLAANSYEHPDSLEPTAKALGLTVQTTDWFTRDQGEGIAQYPKVRAVAFGPQVMQEQMNSEPLELAHDRVVVLHKADYAPARPQALEQVRARVVEQVQRAQALSQVEQRGAAGLQQLQQGTPLAQLAEAEKLAVQTQAALPRQGQTGLPAELQAAIFRAPRPVADKPSVGGVKLATGDYAWFSLSAVQDGAAPAALAPAPTPDSLLAAQRRQAETSSLMDGLRSRAEVELRLPATPQTP